MRQKQYKAIAKIVKKRVKYCAASHDDGADLLAYDLADYFESEDALFDKEGFLETCFEE